MRNTTSHSLWISGPPASPVHIQYTIFCGTVIFSPYIFFSFLRTQFNLSSDPLWLTVSSLSRLNIVLNLKFKIMTTGLYLFNRVNRFSPDIIILPLGFHNLPKDIWTYMYKTTVRAHKYKASSHLRELILLRPNCADFCTSETSKD